ncbi:ABC transporter permease [Streptosporangium carneum]|uniref:ABC transporter permease n=1 Tax=Streptosporangium carneum TaxID=47481 RepID=A0A9W6I8I6_9ACTN|nr:ABC transporter permease [Streptosporangium carneum]GLK13163.1 ABC transporter permease [Streptosporangium carneum]
MRGHTRGQGRGSAWIVIVAVWLFMAAPLAIVVVNSFNASAISQFPPVDWSLRWYHAAVAEESFRDGFALSVRVAFLAATMATVAGLTAAYAFDRFRIPGAATLQSLINTPLSMPKVALGLAGLIGYLTAGSWFGSFKAVFGGGFALTVLHAAMTLPYVVGVLVSALESADRRLESAARDLGAGPVKAFARVVLPALVPGFLISFGFSFMLSFDELESSLFMSSLSGDTLPVAMFTFLETHLDPTLAALSTLLLAGTALAAAAGFAVFRVLQRRTRGVR